MFKFVSKVKEILSVSIPFVTYRQKQNSLEKVTLVSNSEQHVAKSELSCCIWCWWSLTL